MPVPGCPNMFPPIVRSGAEDFSPLLMYVRVRFRQGGSWVVLAFLRAKSANDLLCGLQDFGLLFLPPRLLRLF